MIRFCFVTTLALVGLLLNPSLSNAQARDCVQSRSNVVMGYDDASVAFQVRSGKVCRRHLDYPQFELKRFDVVERPRHGSITDLGRGRWEYRAKSGYQGSDNFKLRWVGNRVDWRTGTNQGPTLIGARFSVTVVK